MKIVMQFTGPETESSGSRFAYCRTDAVHGVIGRRVRGTHHFTAAKGSSLVEPVAVADLIEERERGEPGPPAGLRKEPDY
ncbi:MAG: hypothetical protein CO095_00365 [Armatimonadetes bacterium CG_4_9_14_3_um_filter_58_7]|nr:MAG: hypothetical protein CO095_00365 [Armatimonadetes bacterium CG_4_9_14_3_um_filter_58_7]